MSVVRDRLWLWGHAAGSHNGRWGLLGESRVTPTEAAHYLGIPNLVMVVFADRPAPPFGPYAAPMRSLSRTVWSIVGDASSGRTHEGPDLGPVLDLVETLPNLEGAIMDDFFHAPDAEGRAAYYSVAEIAGFRRQLRRAERPLALWVVLYRHDLGLPVGEYLGESDVVSFWTWEAKELDLLPESFARVEALAPRARKVLGCYLWDYGASQPMPMEQMVFQCETGLEWLREGRIEGMIFLASCICDLGLEAVEWVRGWIAGVGEESVPGVAHGGRWETTF